MNDWDFAAIRPSTCWTTSKDLASYPRFILRNFFYKYKTKCPPSAEVEEGGGGHAPMELEGEGAGSAAHGHGDDEVQAMDIPKMALFCMTPPPYTFVYI